MELTTRQIAARKGVETKRKNKMMAEIGPSAYEAEISCLREEITKLNRENRRAKGGEAIIIGAIKEIFNKPIKPIPITKKTKRRSKKEIPVLHLSDLHIGKITRSFNIEIAKQRLDQITHKVIESVDLRRTRAQIDELRIYLGGDLIEGEGIFPHQCHETQGTVLEQAVRYVPTMLSSMFFELLKHFKKIKVVCVAGNHGRVAPKGVGISPKTNWDIVCCEVLKAMMLGSEENPRNNRISFDISDDFYNIDYVFDYGQLIVHGEQMRGGAGGFPYSGTSRKMLGWIDSIPMPWDYLWFGHYHTYVSGVVNHRIFLANGTLESDNEYAQQNLASTGFPCQRLSFFNKDEGMINDNQLLLLPHISQKGRYLEWKK